MDINRILDNSNQSENDEENDMANDYVPSLYHGYNAAAAKDYKRRKEEAKKGLLREGDAGFHPYFRRYQH